MDGVLRLIRDDEVKITLPGPSITIKKDGTVWYQGSPILGITDPVKKAEAAKAVKAKKFDKIPSDAFCRIGKNPNGLELVDDAAWATHPLKAAQEAEAAREAEIARKTVTIYLSSRGWGDYSPCEWVGDITRPDDEILAECRKALVEGWDVDNKNQTDDEILKKISTAREKYESEPARKAAREKAEAEALQRMIDNGYCFNCETYCHGDCGNYSNDPAVMYRRRLRESAREANYGIEE
ncbi:MAG: hypothetical protein QM235_12130 [Pseudomonadota bacterium]|nr:hypothetical protein [Pseudomonadota bacterium]